MSDSSSVKENAGESPADSCSTSSVLSEEKPNQNNNNRNKTKDSEDKDSGGEEDHDLKKHKHHHHSRAFLGKLRPDELAVAGSKRARRRSVLLDQDMFTTSFEHTQKQKAATTKPDGTDTPGTATATSASTTADIPSSTPTSNDPKTDPKPVESQPRRRRSKSTKTSEQQKQKKISVCDRLPEDLRRCYEVVRALMKCSEASAFIEPVDPVALQLPHYAEIVPHPMDLGTVRKNIEKGVYNNAAECHADVMLVFNNALAFNPLGNPVHACAAALKDVYAGIFGLNCDDDTSTSSSTTQIAPPPIAVEAVTAAEIAASVKSCYAVRSAEGRRRVYEDELQATLQDDTPVNSAERKEIAEQLEEVSGKSATDVADVLAMYVKVSRPKAFDKPQNNSDCAEIDFDQLDQLTLQAIKQRLTELP